MINTLRVFKGDSNIAFKTRWDGRSYRTPPLPRTNAHLFPSINQNLRILKIKEWGEGSGEQGAKEMATIDERKYKS